MTRSKRSGSGASSEPAASRPPEEILTDYRDKGIGGRVGFGRRPAVLVVDLIRGFTDPTSPLGSDLDAVVGATARLITEARRAQAPVFLTVTAYGPSRVEGGLFFSKVPSLEILRRGGSWTELDPRLEAGGRDTVIEKQYASAFFGTPLASALTAHGIDTLLVAGATTSGCIRATVIDALQHGFRAIVPRQCVGDRAPEAHRANLLDIDGKYGDVVELEKALDYLGSCCRGSETDPPEEAGK